jgi:hypothetical protein
LRLRKSRADFIIIKRNKTRVALQIKCSESTMLHVWLIPAIIVLAAIVSLLYLAIRKQGSASRAEGRTLHDLPMDEDNPPP